MPLFRDQGVSQNILNNPKESRTPTPRHIVNCFCDRSASIIALDGYSDVLSKDWLGIAVIGAWLPFSDSVTIIE